MTKKVIAIDVDEVLANSTEVVRMGANKKAGLNLETHHFKIPGPYWRYFEHVLETNGVKDDSINASVYEYWDTNQLHAPPVDGAMNVLKTLSKDYKIVLITARDPKWHGATKEWLEKHFAGLYHDLHVIGNFKVLDTPRSKGEVCAEVGASWLIDDNPEHCLSAIAHNVEAILFGDYGWHFDAPEHLTRCKDWPAIVRYFNEQPR